MNQRSGCISQKKRTQKLNSQPCLKSGGVPIMVNQKGELQNYRATDLMSKGIQNKYQRLTEHKQRGLYNLMTTKIQCEPSTTAPFVSPLKRIFLSFISLCWTLFSIAPSHPIPLVANRSQFRPTPLLWWWSGRCWSISPWLRIAGRRRCAHRWSRLDWCSGSQ